MWGVKIIIITCKRQNKTVETDLNIYIQRHIPQVHNIIILYTTPGAVYILYTTGQSQKGGTLIYGQARVDGPCSDIMYTVRVLSLCSGYR